MNDHNLKCLYSVPTPQNYIQDSGFPDPINFIQYFWELKLLEIVNVLVKLVHGVILMVERRVVSETT